jgi:hypothetical protein
MSTPAIACRPDPHLLVFYVDKFNITTQGGVPPIDLFDDLL